MPTPKYDGQRWRIRVQKDGRKFSFSSSIAGARGRKECMAKYEAWLYDHGPAHSKTCARVCEDYLEDLKARRGEQSEAYIQNERYIRLYIAPAVGSVRMSKITLREWQGVINGATGRKKPLSKKTLENLRAIITAIVKYGYANYECELLRGVLYIPQGHAPTKEKEILQPAQLKRLFEPSGLWYHPLFCFLAITGMRPSEALGLQVEDIVGDRAYIKRGVNAKGSITSGKNSNARRMVPLGALALGIINKTIERNERHNLHTPWIFCDKYGNAGKQSTMRNQWQELKDERGLSGTIYGLRHTFISITKSVLPEATIKDIVGHSVSMDTFGTYGHIVDGESKHAAQVIDLTFGQVFGQHLTASDGLTP